MRLSLAAIAVPIGWGCLDTPAAAATPHLLAEATGWVFEQQRLLHRELSSSLRLLQTDAGVLAAATLIIVSFLYGIFHAAGPGHGKAVLSTYLLTHESHLKRGVALAAAAALCQGLSAIVLVNALVWLFGLLPGDAAAAVLWSERASYLLVAALGLFLTGRIILTRRRPARGHDHHHHHACGHQHAPSPAQVAEADSLRAAAGVVLSIGLRPCSGAVLVLGLARIIGLSWAGVAAVAAMSAGTALTVGVLAFAAVKTRHWSRRLGGRLGPGVGPLADGVALLGGLLILALGVVLLVGSFGARHPLGLS